MPPTPCMLLLEWPTYCQCECEKWKQCRYMTSRISRASSRRVWNKSETHNASASKLGCNSSKWCKNDASTPTEHQNLVTMVTSSVAGLNRRCLFSQRGSAHINASIHCLKEEVTANNSVDQSWPGKRVHTPHLNALCASWQTQEPWRAQSWHSRRKPDATCLSGCAWWCWQWRCSNLEPNDDKPRSKT